MKALIAGLTLLSLGCVSEVETGDNGSWTGTVDTLASGTLVVRNPDLPLWPEGQEWTLREVFRLGRVDGEGPEVFGEIRDLELGPGGEVYILDSQASEIRTFSSTGEHLVTFGRSGEGPGELNRPAGMALDSNETLWVMNWGNARYTGFDPATGEVRQEVRRQASYAMIPWPGRFDSSDRLLDIGLGSDREPAILRLDSAFVPRDTLPLPRPDDANLIMFRDEGRTMMSAMVPFAPRPLWAAHPRNGIVIGAGADYLLHQVNFEGDTLVTIAVSREPVPVTKAERDSALAAFQQLAEMAGGQPDRQPRVPAYKPPHGPITVDDQSRIWVRRTPSPEMPTAWDVIGEDGRWLGTVSLPMASWHDTPAVRGDRMAVFTLIDAVPTVIVYEIVRPG